MNLFWRQGRRQISGLERLQWGNRTTFGGLCPVTDHKWRLLVVGGCSDLGNRHLIAGGHLLG